MEEEKNIPDQKDLRRGLVGELSPEARFSAELGVEGWRGRVGVAVLLLLCCIPIYNFLFGSVDWIVAERRAGEDAVGVFHKKYGEGDMKSIYNSATWFFRETYTEAEFENLMKSRRERWGQVIKTRNEGFLLEVLGRYAAAEGYSYGLWNIQIIELWQLTNFENAEVMERFVFAKSKKDEEGNRIYELLSYDPTVFPPSEEAEKVLIF